MSIASTPSPNRRPPIIIRPYLPDDEEAVARLNSRLEAGDAEFRLAASAVPDWLPPRPGVELYQEYFLAVEGTEVRGGYTIKRQPFDLRGKTVSVSHYKLPLSEGIVDRTYSLLGTQLLRHASQGHSLMFALGMGGLHRPLPRQLGIMKWGVHPSPFFFYVCHPDRFLREIVYLRQRRSRRCLLDALAYSGLGYAIIKAAHALRTKPEGRRDGVTIDTPGRFGEWADAVWEKARPAYAMIAVRDFNFLDLLYPEANPRFHRIRIRRDGGDVGWAVALCTSMNRHKQFGRMRVGSIVDCLAVPGEEAAVIAAATRYIKSLRPDIIVSNQLHARWCDAFTRNGYLSGPSNYIFAASPRLNERLISEGSSIDRVHITRGDGDGPIHL